MKKMRLNKTLSKNAPTILTIIGIAGMWVTTYMVAKSAAVVKEKIEDNIEVDPDIESPTKENYHLPSKLQTVKMAMPVIWPSLVVGGFSTYCIIMANHVNLRRNAALSSAYILSRNALHEYRAKVIEHLGERKEQKIKDEVAKETLEKNPIENRTIIVTGDGDHLCYDAVFGTYFDSNIEKVKQVILNINERLLSEMYITVNDFRYELGLPPVEAGRDLGWNIENGQMAVEFSSQLASNGKPCLTIRYDVVPV